jgi:hypothetical protein
MTTAFPRLPALRRFLLTAVVASGLVGAGGCSKQPSETLTLVYSNDMIGEIRSCGCPADDFGGLGRRATFLEIVRDSTKNFLLVDAGDFFNLKLSFGKVKADITMKSMALMDYHAVVIGEKDLGFGIDYIVQRSRETGLPVLVANLYDAVGDTLFFPPSTVVTFPSGLTVGIIGVMGSDLRLPQQVEPGSVRIEEPLRTVRREVDRLKDGVDLIVVVAHAHLGTARRIATEIPEVDVVVHGHEGKPMRKVQRVGEGFVLENAEKGLYMGVAFAVLDRDNRRIRRLSNQIIPMSNQYPDNEAVAKLFRAYGMSVAAKQKGQVPAAVFEAKGGLAFRFAGSGACRECHEAEYAVWEETTHAHAFATLEAESREEDRDCIPCHTTGFYKRGGYERLSVTPDLVDVGCEACHGNGHDHILDPKAEGTLAVAAETCTGCHTEEQTPDFEFETFWDRIRH